MEKEKLFGRVITDTEERVSKRVDTLPRIFLPPVGKMASGSDEDYKRQSFRVRPEKEKEIRLVAEQAWVHHRAGRFEESNKLVRSIYEYNVSLSDEPILLWNHAAKLLSPEIGINSWEKDEVREIISSQCQRGKALEAFAGFNSFINSKSGLEVVAMDYCEEALKRYPFPERQRVLFDLNALDGTNTIGNFFNNEFDYITICAGYKYPERLDFIFSEFGRILISGGQIIMVEHEYAGSTIHSRREFVPRECKKKLKQAGFSSVSVEALQVARGDSAGKYFLTIAQK